MKINKVSFNFFLEMNHLIKILTKYTAPKLPCPISRRSEKSFSGSSLKKRSAISGSFRLPARLLLGIMGSVGAMPLPPGTIWVCDSDLEAPTDGSSAGRGSHMCSELKRKARTDMLVMWVNVMFSCTLKNTFLGPCY